MSQQPPPGGQPANSEKPATTLQDVLVNFSQRLAALELQIKQQSQTHNQDLHRSVQELKNQLQEQQLTNATLYQQLETTLKQQSQQGQSASVSNTVTSQIVTEMQKQIYGVETHLDRSANDIKGVFNDRHVNLKENLDSHSRTIERLFSGTKDYFNKLLFYVGILLVVLFALSGALIIHSIDQMNHYMLTEMDALRASLEKTTAPIAPKIDEPVKGTEETPPAEPSSSQGPPTF
jgi:Ca2+-dependent lipid-binding protein